MQRREKKTELNNLKKNTTINKQAINYLSDEPTNYIDDDEKRELCEQTQPKDRISRQRKRDGVQKR